MNGRILAGMGAGIVLAICLALALATGAPAATSAGSRSARLRILTPSRGALVTGKRLVVRVDARGSHFRAKLDGRDVSRRFGAAKGGVRSATFRRGRDFRLGANSVRVEVGKGSGRRAASRSFQALIPANRRMRVRRLAPRANRAPIELHMQTKGKIARARLWVNGRRVSGALTRARDRRHLIARLGATDGVRYGRNLVVAEVRYRDHRVSRTARAFRVSRRRPLPGAGLDRRTVPGRGVSLDGTATKRARKGRRLLYRWTVLRKPAGSKVGVENSRSPRGRLRADIPGVYRVRLTVAEVGRGGANRGGGRAHGSSAAPEESSSAAPKEPSSCPATPVEPSETSETPPLPLSPPEEETGPIPVNPLSPLLCVAPTPEEHPPALPAAAPVAADEVTVKVAPTENPMGETLQTLAADGSIRIGDRPPYQSTGGFAHMLVLNEETLLPEAGAWGSGNQGIAAGEAAALLGKVEKTARHIVILNGNGVAQPAGGSSLEEAVGKVFTLFGGALPDNPESRNRLLAAAVKSGDWSMVGTVGEAGRTYANLGGLSEVPPPGDPEASLAGGLNGYLQIVAGSAYSFVSAEVVPVDTRAQGSTENQNVIEVGTQTFTSGSVPNGELAVHLLVLPTDGAGGLTGAGNQVTPLDQETYVIDQANNRTNQGFWDASAQRGEGVMGLAYDLERWRSYAANDLIVMQTFGENGVANNTAPGASPNWVNDALIPNSNKGLFLWHEQPYVAAGSSGLQAALVKMWNPGYPTVAGQVGALTGPVGHDLIANFGASENSDNNGGYAVTRLSMVASNHPAAPELNYVKGTGPNTGGPTAAEVGRLVGTMTRNHQAQWTVQAASPNPEVDSSSLWQLAFQPPTAWPDSGTPQFAAAMRYIAKHLWRNGEITNVRAAYVAKETDFNSETKEEIERIAFQPGLGFGEAEFDALQKQLVVEVGDVIRVKEIIGEWRKILGEASLSGYVNAQGIAGKIEEQAIGNTESRNSTSGLDPNAILSQGLYIGATLLGPESFGVSDGVAVAAGALGLIDAIIPESGSTVAPGPNPARIRDRASELGSDLVDRFNVTSSTLEHLGDIFMSDWGKLSTAAEDARGPWAFGHKVREAVRQALAISTATAFYEAMVPVAYRLWVIAPYVTVTNGNGPERPGNNYKCIQYGGPFESNKIGEPFGSEPAGAMSWVNYRPWESPGSTTFPAQPYTQNYTVRALKSWNDQLGMHQQQINENEESAGITIERYGGNPPAELVNNMFKPINPAEADAELPTDLGMNKVEFYANYGSGLNWARTICAEYYGE